MTATLLADRAVIRLSPASPDEDVADFLQGLLTNDVKGSLPAYAGLLGPQGKCLFDMIVWHGGPGELLIDCEAAAADDLVKRLGLYRLRRKIDIVRDDTIEVHWQKQIGDGAPPDPRLPALGERWVKPVENGSRARTAETADEEWRAHRLALGVAEGQAEMADVLWLETNAVELNGVSFDKGCYVGQENTARMNWRQKVNRRLVVVPAGSVDEKRVRATYDAPGKSVALLRIDDIEPSVTPEWMRLEPRDARED